MELSRSENYLNEITFWSNYIFLQKSYLKIYWRYESQNYSVYSTYVDEDERTACGSTVLIRGHILYISVNLQAFAVRISLNETIIICPCVYSIQFITSLSLAQLEK
jgi:hypothetical protein